MACLGCNKTCSCALVAGAGITMSGTGNTGSPWTVSAVGASEFVDDSCSVSLSGDGSLADPLIADLNIATSGGLKCTDAIGVGIKVDPASTSTITFSASGIRIDSAAGIVVTDECIAGDGSGGDPIVLVVDPVGGLECGVDGVGILLDPLTDPGCASLSADGLLVVCGGGGGTVSVTDPITGDGSGGDPLALALAAAGGLDVAGGELEILLDPASDPACVSLSAAGLLISCGGAGGGGLYSPDNPDAWIDAFGAASAYDCEFNRTTNPTALPTNWVYQNQNSATYLEQVGNGIVSIPSGTNNIASVTCVVQPVSAAGAYTAVGHTANLNLASGLILTDGTKGMGIVWHTNPLVLTPRWTDIAGTYLDNPGSVNPLFRPEYFRIVKNNANSYDFAFSTNGAVWYTVLAAYDVGAFMTPTHFGFVINQGPGVVEASLDWFRVR